MTKSPIQIRHMAIGQEAYRTTLEIFFSYSFQPSS